MSTLKRWTRRSPLVVIVAALLGASGHVSVQARQADTLGSQLAALSGTGLTMAECRQRMQALETLLQRAGYRNVRTQTLADGTLLARWYNPGRQMTALAFSGQNSTGNAFAAREYAGLLRWNELITVP